MSNDTKRDNEQLMALRNSYLNNDSIDEETKERLEIAHFKASKAISLRIIDNMLELTDRILRR